MPKAERWAYGMAALTGAATWFYIASASGRREAWDSDLYFSVGLPIIALVAAVLGFLVPHRAWRWAFVPFGAQALAAFVQNPTANLLPIGLIVFGFFGVGCLVPTYVGVAIARVFKRVVGLVLCMSAALMAQGGAPPAGRTRIVDHHQHLFSPSIAKLSPSVAPVAASDLIALLDAAGIQGAAVFSLAYQFGNPNKPVVENEYAHVRAENDWTSQQVAKYPDRLRAFCSVNPLRDYAVEEVHRCAKDPQLRVGLKMHFGNSDVDVTDPAHLKALRAVFRAANDHRMAIIVHMRTTISKQRPYGAAHARAFLDSLLPEALDVPVQIAHLCGAGSYDATAVDEVVQVFVGAIAKRDPRMSRVLFDVSGVAGLGPWKERAPLIARRIRELGVERMLYGSDGAGGANRTPREALAFFRELPLTAAELHAVEGNVAPYMR